MKSFTVFLAGVFFVAALVAVFFLGGLTMLGFNKDAAKVGHIEIGQKLYRLVPAEVKAIEQEQNCCVK